jgi:hypothetical protein
VRTGSRHVDHRPDHANTISRGTGARGTPVNLSKPPTNDQRGTKVEWSRRRGGRGRPRKGGDGAPLNGRAWRSSQKTGQNGGSGAVNADTSAHPLHPALSCRIVHRAPSYTCAPLRIMRTAEIIPRPPPNRVRARTMRSPSACVKNPRANNAPTYLRLTSLAELFGFAVAAVLTRSVFLSSKDNPCMRRLTKVASYFSLYANFPFGLSFGKIHIHGRAHTGTQVFLFLCLRVFFVRLI